MLRHVRTTTADPAVLVGLDMPDDAGVYRVAPGLAIVQSVDFFTPIVDDPYDWGRIAAANAVSDLYAMGARPATALNLVSWPRDLDLASLGRVLEGAAAVADEAGMTVIGGHTIDDPEPKFGMAVTGVADPDRIVTTSGAVPGGELVLTKPLGTGIVSSAIKEGKAPLEAVQAAVDSMARLNAAASQAMLETGVAAATDVTGFGLVGHLAGMLDRELSAHLRFSALPLLPGAIELADRGVLPGGTRRNRDAHGDRVRADDLSEAERWLLFDAQTSGGLLIASRPEAGDELLAVLRRHGVDGARIGTVVEGNGTVTVER